MKKIVAGLVCVSLAVVIAMLSVGCGSGSELTYTGDYQTTSSGTGSTTSSGGQVSQTSGAETVLYPLTTQQGETVQVISTTAPSTEIPTMSYDPVTVSPMPTEYTSSSTTVYVPPTYTPAATSTVTTKPVTTTTTEATTKPPIKYKNVNGNADGGVDGKKIKVWVDNIFGKKIKEKSGAVTIDFASTTYKASCKVLSKLYAGEQVEIQIDVPSDLTKSVESSGESLISISVPKGIILSEDNVSNNAFRVTVSAYDL